MAIRSVALAGMVADTSLYNIDGACVVAAPAEKRIMVGSAVGFTTVPAIDGHKVVDATITADIAPYGVVVRSSYETPDGFARGQEAVNVMTAGRIWVKASAAIAEANRGVGKPVFVNGTGLVVDATAASTTVFATGWTFAGGYIAAATAAGAMPTQNDSVDGILVEVQVKQK